MASEAKQPKSDISFLVSSVYFWEQMRLQIESRVGIIPGPGKQTVRGKLVQLGNRGSHFELLGGARTHLPRDVWRRLLSAPAAKDI